MLEAAEAIRRKICYFPANTTELTQPCDAFVIQMIKTAWRCKWDEQKLSLTRCNAWTEDERLPSPSKSFFLQMAADAANDISWLRENEALKYVRKEMILHGMAPDVNRLFDEAQFKPQSQNIIKKHRHSLENPDDY